jgi:organic radical activating enzyme
MNCLFCSYSNEIQRKRDVADNEDIVRFLKILGMYKDLKKQEILISWIGGEPFLWEHIIPFSKEINEHYGINISTTTNIYVKTTDDAKKELSSVMASKMSGIFN